MSLKLPTPTRAVTALDLDEATVTGEVVSSQSGGGLQGRQGAFLHPAWGSVHSGPLRWRAVHA